MEDEIDLRPYIELLIKRWYWIVGAAILAGLIAFGVTSLQDDVYEATALIAVTQDRLIARFDPRLDTSDEPQPIKALPELATSDDILVEVLNNLDPPVVNIDSLNELNDILAAVAGSDPSLINLSAIHSNPVEAARITNLWAEIFVGAANDIFGDGNGDQLIFFEEQLEQAGEELAAAEAVLVTFQGTNRQALLTNMVEAFDLSQDEYLAEQQELAQLKSNVEGLREQIAESNGTNTVSFADQLTALFLQLRAFNSALELPIQLQLDGTGGFSGTSRDDQLAYLEALQDTMTSRSAVIEQELADLEPDLLGIQKELQRAEAEYNRLILNRDVAQETYLSLARKVDEERITAEDMTRGIRLASRAAVPEESVGPRRLTFVAIGAIIGALIAMALVVIRVWWSNQTADKE